MILAARSSLSTTTSPSVKMRKRSQSAASNRVTSPGPCRKKFKRNGSSSPLAADSCKPDDRNIPNSHPCERDATDEQFHLEKSCRSTSAKSDLSRPAQIKRTDPGPSSSAANPLGVGLPAVALYGLPSSLVSAHASLAMLRVRKVGVAIQPKNKRASPRLGK